MFSTLHKLFTFLDKRTRVTLGLLLAPMLLIAVMELASIGLIIPVIQVLLPDGPKSRLGELIAEQLPNWTADQTAILLCTAFALFVVIKNVLTFVLNYIINRVIAMKTAALAARMFELYLRRPLLFHLERNSAEILRNLMSGVSQSFEGVRLVLFLVLDALLMAAAFTMLVLVEPAITFTIAGIVGIFSVGSHLLLAPAFKNWGERTLVLEGREIKLINESMAGIRDVKVRNAYDFIVHAYRSLTERRAGIVSISNSTINIPRIAIETAVVIGFMILTFALTAAGTPSSEVVAVLGVFAMAALRLMPSLNRILTNAAGLKNRVAYIDSLAADLEAGERELRTIGQEADSADFGFKSVIHFNAITYSYPNASQPALRAIEFALPKGQSLGIVGPSGAGKSTIIDILLGLLVPDTGQLLVDGHRVQDNLTVWCRYIGFVPQQIYIPDDTIRRNIAYGLPDKLIDEARVNLVANLAQLDDVVARMPAGLDTILGEAGTRISGGQRQRIAIARALYHDPEVLIFDEATSALDTETEAGVGQAIASLAGTKTIVVIAHRLSTIERCDQIIFLKDGRIECHGSYAELLATNSAFRQFVDADRWKRTVTV